MMSDYIESDGRKYYEESYLVLANSNTERANSAIATLVVALKDIASATPKWSENVGSYAGGETWHGFALRLKARAFAALQEGDYLHDVRSFE